MTKKRALVINSLRVPDCDGLKDDPNCSEFKSKPFEEKQYIPNYISYASIPKSKFWMSLLGHDLNADDSYSNFDRRHKKRKEEDQNKYSEWRIPQMEVRFLSDLENSDGDY